MREHSKQDAAKNAIDDATQEILNADSKRITSSSTTHSVTVVQERSDAASTNEPTVLASLSTTSVFAGTRRGVISMRCVPSEEGVEGEAGDEDAAYELDDAREDEEDEEGVDECQAAGSGVEGRGSEGLQGDRGRGRLSEQRCEFSVVDVDLVLAMLAGKV